MGMVSNINLNDKRNTWRIPSKCEPIFANDSHFGNCFKYVMPISYGYSNVSPLYLKRPNGAWGLFYFSTQNI